MKIYFIYYIILIEKSTSKSKTSDKKRNKRNNSIKENENIVVLYGVFIKRILSVSIAGMTEEEQVEEAEEAEEDQDRNGRGTCNMVRYCIGCLPGVCNCIFSCAG